MEVQTYSYDITSAERSIPGFHTFVMTGDAIIKTNFNPFKPTREIPMDNPIPESCTADRPSPSIHRKMDMHDPDAAHRAVAGTTDAGFDKKAFIPGFVRLDPDNDVHKTQHEKTLVSGQPYTDCITHDSGIDVTLSNTTDDQQNCLNSSSARKSHHSQFSAEEMAAAQVLSTQLYHLDGFTPDDVSHYLITSYVSSLVQMHSFKTNFLITLML